MSTEIGLAEFIQQVKKELLTTYPKDENDTPILCVDSVELELQVTVKTEGKGGVKINVLLGGEFSGGVSRDGVQKIKVQLSPLLTKEQILKAYYKENPEKWQKFLETTVDALLKGDGQSNLNEHLVD
ncbi:MAG: trypco2 family protein [Nostoc sp. DedQUE11]|nr:trypco2 family protein [Nostoc sp. DedQUE11]